MSGRSAPNRGKKSHRKGSDLPADTRQSGSSSNHSNNSRYPNRETAPRFLSRHKNDVKTGGPGDYCEDGGGRRGGSGGRSSTSGSNSNGGGGRANNFEDLMQIITRLDQSQDVDGSIRIAKMILDFLERHAGDYHLKQVLHVGRNVDSILQTLERVIQENTEKELLCTIEECIGAIGHILRDAQRLLEWIFFNVNLEENSAETKAVFLRGLYELMSSEGGKSPHGPLLPYVVDSLQSVLEVAESPVLLKVLMKDITLMTKLCPQHLAHHFKNTVDLLVGWHIDIQQDQSLIDLISTTLISMGDFWIKDMTYSVELLLQFFEDMEAYNNELSGVLDEYSQQSNDDTSSPEQCLSKLTALIRVFTTVLTSLGTNFSPARNTEITPGFVKMVVNRLISFVVSANDVAFSEDLLIAGNKCLMELSKCLQGHLANHSHEVAIYILRQWDDDDLCSQRHASSIVRLLSQIVEDLQSSLPTQFVQDIFSLDSPVLMLRYIASEKLLVQLIKLYNSFLAIRNIPLLDIMYRLIIADLDNSFKHLNLCLKEPAYSNSNHDDGHTSSHNPLDAQVAIVFDLNILSQISNTSKAIIGMWSPNPSVFSLIKSNLNALTGSMASEYPAIHYSLLYALFQDCRSNRNYLPGVKPSSGTSVSRSVTAISSSSSSVTIYDILSLLTRQMQAYMLPGDICSLIQLWVDNIVDNIRSTDKEAISMEELRSHMDHLACQLIALTFSREHTIRLDNSAVLKSLLQHKLISDEVIKKIIPECLMRLSDTRGEIRAAYSALLEVVPTHIMTSFSQGIDTFQPPNGRKRLEGLRNCKGTWHARRIHMTKQSQVTFHGHHFKAIMGFIMHGYAPSKHLPDDWLERMYHSCQHRRPPIPDILDHSELHPMLMSYLVCNCDAVLWFWASYESAQYCLLARLRTPLGMPAETFSAIEAVLQGYAAEVESHDGKHSRDTPSSFSGHMGAGLGPRHYTVHLRAVLLLQFIEHLDKLMYNAYEGSCVTLPPVPKSVRTFFRKNVVTCQDWFSHMRSSLVSIAIHAGMPAVAVRHGFAALKDLSKHPFIENVDFWKMVINVVHALLLMGSWQAIQGMGVWLEPLVDSIPLWITAAEEQGKASYESACEEYLKALELLQKTAGEQDHGNPALKAITSIKIQFVVNRICECYMKVSDWKNSEDWHCRVSTMRSQYSDLSSPELASAFKLKYDLNQIRALSHFDVGDLAGAREYVERQSDQRHPSRDPEVFPLWDPGQLLNASHLLLLKAVTFQAGDEGSGSDSSGNSGEGEAGPKSSKQRWLKLSSAYAESPLRVGTLEWPLRISPVHSLQLQSAAALRALNPIKSRHAQVVSSALLLHTIPFKSLYPACHDSGVWSEALQISSHLARSSSFSETKDRFTPPMLLESYRLARNQGNLKYSHNLIQRQIVELTGETHSEALDSSPDISPTEKLRIMREVAKLYSSRGQAGHAIDLLANSIVSFSKAAQKRKETRSTTSATIGGSLGSGSELAARSLLAIVKWMQSDARLMQTIWSSDYDTSRKLSLLLEAEYECRKGRTGLYESASSVESYELFLPDESLARFDKHEYCIGQLLHLSTMYCPDLAKGWWSLAGWCYRIGRKNLEALSGTGTATLLEEEQEKMDVVINQVKISGEHRTSIMGILGQVHISDSAGDEDLKAKEDIKHLDMEEDSKSLRSQLLAACPPLEKLPSPSFDTLLSIWAGVRVRMFMHYQLSARAYFTFLKLSGSQAGSSPGLDDMNVTASLRLLRLLVKYAGELKSELENGFITTPTKPWKDIIPQLFSRLNHPENGVRQSVSELLCRVGHDSPHFIIYPAIVGNSRKSEKKAESVSADGLLQEEGEDQDGNGTFELGSRDLLGDSFTPSDPTMDSGNQGESSPIEQTNLEKSLSLIIDSLKQQNAVLVKDVEDLVSELCRITLLWDEMWLAALMQRQGEVHRRLVQIDQETKRTMSIPHLNMKEKEAIMKEKYMATMKPLLWVLEHLAFITSQPPETPNERNFQTQYGDTINSAIQRLKNPSNYSSPQAVWEPFKEFQQMLMVRAQKRMQNSLSLSEISPHLAAISSSCISMPGHSQGDEPVTLESFQLEVSVLPTKTKPKKISMIGSDGRKHTYLFKGLEDLHLDERIMQFMAIVNNMFTRAHKHHTQLYLAKDYAVIPLGARSGLIQWVDAVTPLFGIYKRWQQRETYARAVEQADGQPMAMPLQVMKPNELFYSKIIPLLKENGLSEQTPRKDWPKPIQLRVLKELMAETPSDLLAKELWCASSCASEWWAATQTYCRSTAVMCMIGYIIGLGDRHLDNLLVEFATGQVVHVDYNVCFEKGQSLRVPERVPFRMTQNIEGALGFTGVDGLFRISCEDILRILRRGRETLLTLLEAFVYDPLIDWTQSEDAAFPLAVSSSKDQAGRPSRKEMEREVASGLLVTKLSESGSYWQRNRESLCSVLLSLELYLDEIAKTGNKLASYNSVVARLDNQAEILRDALSTPDHPLVSMQEKLTEQSRMIADHKRLVGDIKDQYADAEEWYMRYIAAFRGIHGSELGSLISAMQKPLELGPPGHEPAVDFLSSSGSSQAIEACDQLEHELIDLLQRRRELLINALEALHQYRNITAQFHADYLKQSRSYLWKVSIAPALEGDLTQDILLKVLDDFECRLNAGSRPENVVKAVDSKFRKSAQEVHIRYSKIFERSKQLSSLDKNQLDSSVHDASMQLSQFCQENPHTGPPSLACFIIIALCPLSRRWLFMEHTAQAARDRLSDLTSKDGDWFLDELCTMSGNVSQMICLLEMCLTSMGHEIQIGTVLYSTIAAVSTVHTVYSSMQDLFNKFLSLVLPEAINNILSEEETTLEMFDTVSNFTLTSYPNTPILQALNQLTEGLKECALKSSPANLSMTAAVEELRNKFSSLLVSPGRDSKMTPAQVILNSMYGLFQKTEMSTLKLMEVISNVQIPDNWQTVDLIKQTSSLMDATDNSSLADELLFVRKTQAIIEFCTECKNLLKAFKLDITPPDSPNALGFQPPTPPGTPSRKSPSLHVPTESSFGLPIRRYIAEILIGHVLGQPSYSLACFLISTITQYLQIEIPRRTSSVVIPVEEVCKLANDHYQTVLPMHVIQHARTLFSQHDVAWRDGDRIRRLMTNLENSKLSLQRTRGIATRFQWLHEEVLTTDTNYNSWIGPQRLTILSTIKKVLGDTVASSLSSVLDKTNSQQFRISQRLQWAAGANPSFNSVVDEYERATNHRKQILQQEEDLYLQILEFCEAVIHLESTHTRVSNKTENDKDTIMLLRRCTDVTGELKSFSEQLSQVSELLTQIDLPDDGTPITLQWMKSRQDGLMVERSHIFNEKRNDNNKLTKHKEMVLSELEKLKGLNRAHRKLMVEVWPHLTSLARLEEPPPMGQIQPGPRGFINLQNKFGEEVRSFIQSAQDLIASDMSLTAKPALHSKFRPDDFVQMKMAAENLRVLAESLLGQLLSFTDQLFQGQPCGNLKWSPPPIIENLIHKSVSCTSITSAMPGGQTSETDPQQQQPQQQQANKSIYRSSQGVVRDKKTGKALQEQNPLAVGVWRRVKEKLDGRDFEANVRMTVAEQVKFVVGEATSLENLCMLYEGWTPWV